MIFCGTQVELNNLSEKINQIHPTFKFSLESSNTEVTYLFNPKMSTTPITQSIGYQNSFRYLHRQSCHPDSGPLRVKRSDRYEHVVTKKNFEESEILHRETGEERL